MSWWHWIIVVLVAWWIIANPAAAAADVHGIGAFFGDIVHGTGGR